MNCQLKKGIFYQRNCNAPANARCGQCGIDVCENHQQIDQGVILCHNCYAKLQKFGTDYGYNKYLESDRNFYFWYWTLRSDYDNTFGLESFNDSDYVGFLNESNVSGVEADYAGNDDFLDS